MALALLINGYTRSGVLREFCPHFGPQPLAVIPHRRDLFEGAEGRDRKSTRLNSSHSQISYAVFCLKKKKTWTVARRIPRSPGPISLWDVVLARSLTTAPASRRPPHPREPALLRDPSSTAPTRTRDR